MAYKFRTLKANEIECKVNAINEKGLSLLLYKTARVDMDILDETVGPDNWQRDHKECKGNLFCGIGIYDKEKNNGYGNTIAVLKALSEISKKAKQVIVLKEPAFVGE